MKSIITLLCLFFALGCHAVDKITVSVTVTNGTTNGMTFVINGSTRTWTNNVFNPSIHVLTNETAFGSKTNLLSQLSLNLPANMTPVDTGEDTFNLIGASGVAMTATASAGYATITYSTQVVATATPVGVPFGTYYVAPVVRTNVASRLVEALGQFATNPIAQISPVAGELVGKTNDQTITGIKIFANESGIWSGSVIQAPEISGTVSGLTNGYFTNSIIDKPTTTNLVNYGNALSSPGSGDFSEEFGIGSQAIGVQSLAIGYTSTASGTESVAIGSFSVASSNSSVAIGNEAQAVRPDTVAIGETANAEGLRSTAIGSSAHASGTNSLAIGVSSFAQHSNSMAIGNNTSTTADNQIILGVSSVEVSIPGNLVAQTVSNLTTVGTNTFSAHSDIAFTRYAITSLANGNNAAVPVGTNVFVEVSGPSGAFTINGIAHGRDGKMVVLLNQTGFDMTVAHQSGTDPTAGNRIISMTGADRTTTGNGAATFMYSGSASRWILINFDP